MLIDGSVITVRSVSHDDRRLRVRYEYDGSLFTTKFDGADDLRRFLHEQTAEDALRALLVQAINRTDGTLKAATFDQLEGRSFRVSHTVEVRQ